MRGVTRIVLAVSASIAATGNGAAVNVSDFQGICQIIMNSDALKKFVRVVDTLAGGANAVVRGVSLVGRKQYT